MSVLDSIATNFIRNGLHYRGTINSDTDVDKYESTQGSQPISYRGNSAGSTNEYISPYLAQIRGITNRDGQTVRHATQLQSRDQTFDAWVKKHSKLLTNSGPVNSRLTSSIDITESYLRALRGDSNYRKFLSTYLLFLKTSYSKINDQKADKLAKLLNTSEILVSSERDVNNFFNKIRGLGLSIF